MRDGVIQESDFADYPLLRMAETPGLHVTVVSTTNPISPAINNAVAALTGRHLAALPMRPEDMQILLKS